MRWMPLASRVRQACLPNASRSMKAGEKVSIWSGIETATFIPTYPSWKGKANVKSAAPSNTNVEKAGNLSQGGHTGEASGENLCLTPSSAAVGLK